MWSKIRSNKLFCMLIAMLISVLLLQSSLNSAFAAEGASESGAKNPSGYIYFSMEKSNIGQGYLIEPVKIPFYEGENLAQVMVRYMSEKGIDIEYTGGTSAFYLSKILDKTSKKANFANHVLQYMKKEGISFEDVRDKDMLGEFDYTSLSGWVYSFDNKHAPVGASGIVPKDNMVVRWAFTVVGYGSDCWDTGWGDMIAPVASDKSKLIKSIADFNGNKDKILLMENDKVKKAYEELIEMGLNPETTNESIEKKAADFDRVIKEAEYDLSATPNKNMNIEKIEFKIKDKHMNANDKIVEFVRGMSSDLSVKIHGDIKNFDEKYGKVTVDEIALIKDVDYVTANGSIIVEIKKSYLDTLSAGKHVVKINTKEGYAQIELNVLEKGAVAKRDEANKDKKGDVEMTVKTAKGAKTADVGYIEIWICAYLVAVSSTVIVIRSRKDKKD